MRKIIKHNKQWFYNRIGQKIYCNDHNDGVKCEGIWLENEMVCDNVRKNQERGIIFNI